MDGLGVKGAFMFNYVEDKEYLSRVRSVCGEIMQDFCHTLKEDYDIGSTFYLVGSGAKNLIVQNEDHYYAVGYSEKHQKIGTFRVDRMKEVNILTADAVEKPADFNLPEFTRQVFDMYDGSTETVTLLCKNDMMNYIIDRFGDDVETAPLDYAHFKAVAKVSVSQTFLGWVFQFNGDIKIIGPVTVVDRYKMMLANALGS